MCIKLLIGRGTKMVRVEKLLLDYENLRLRSPGTEAKQQALLKELYQKYDLSSLITSLVGVGYFKEDPLLVVRNKGCKKGLFTVVDGNLRLVALRILLFNIDRRAVMAKRIPRLSLSVRRELNPVPVRIYRSREEILPYLLLRHMHGVQPWDRQAQLNFYDRLIG